MRWTPVVALLVALPVAAAPVPKHLMMEAQAARRANLEKQAAAYTAMPPEEAGQLVKEAVEAGKLDDVAETLMLMKTRKAAQILEAMGDPATVGKIMARVREIVRTAPPPRLVK